MDRLPDDEIIQRILVVMAERGVTSPEEAKRVTWDVLAAVRTWVAGHDGNPDEVATGLPLDHEACKAAVKQAYAAIRRDQIIRRS